jgi:3-hydroxyisobutyrate dehydrogenase-like beta-hydroxyacid dehydrogenase
MARIGLLHPGQMGLAVGRTLANGGHEVFWTSAGRRPQSAARAAEAGFQDAVTLAALASSCDMIASVCPPEFALDVARAVLAAGFKGLYVDLNAVSPEHKLQMAGLFGPQMVDGGIIGLPTLERAKTWIYLSGPRARQAAALFTHGPLEVEVLDGEVGRASALKMCYAGWNKGSTALLLAILATAGRNDVMEELRTAWLRGGGPSFEKSEGLILRATPKAWRWTGEMREIAGTLESAGLPAAFHRGAEEVYSRLAGFKDSDGLTLAEVLARLT